MWAPLARISHQLSAAATDKGLFTALRSVGLLDVLFKYASGALGRAPCNQTPLRPSRRNLVRNAG